MEGTWTASTQPHSHIPTETSTGKRLLFLNCSGIPVALHTASFAVPREFSLIYDTAWGTCWPHFSFGSAIFCLSVVMATVVAPRLPVMLWLSLESATLAPFVPP